MKVKAKHQIKISGKIYNPGDFFEIEKGSELDRLASLEALEIPSSDFLDSEEEKIEGLPPIKKKK